MSNKELDELRRKWQESAYYWKKNHDFIERIFAPMTKALIEMAAFNSDDRVLDLAAGTGEPSLTIAKLYPDVQITLTDIIHEMVLAARAETQEKRIPNIQFCQCSGDHLPLVDDSFDVVVSRLGIMLFPDVKRALNEMLRVLRLNGRVAFAVWHQRKFNPMSEIVSNVMDEFIPEEPVPFDAPEPFRFSQEGRLKSLLEDAGFSSVKETALDFEINEPMNFETFWKALLEISYPLRDRLNQLTPNQSKQFYTRLEEEFKPHFVTGQLKTSGRILIVSGTK